MDFQVKSKPLSDAEATKFADELELVIGEICNGKRKPQNIPMEPMIALIQFARDRAQGGVRMYLTSGEDGVFAHFRVKDGYQFGINLDAQQLGKRFCDEYRAHLAEKGGAA